MHKGVLVERRFVIMEKGVAVKYKLSVLLGALLALSPAACGDSDDAKRCGDGTTQNGSECVANPVDCGDGTFEVNGRCVAVDPNDSQAPTTRISPDDGRVRDLPESVVLLSDELATIYYTVDGSEPTTASTSGIVAVSISGITDAVPVRFFAVDPAGNEEAQQSVAFTIDRSGPAAVTSLGTNVVDTTADVSWTNPGDADFAGILIVRNSAQTLGFAPEDGVFYAVGDSVGDGGVVVLSADASSVSDAMPGTLITYSAWAYDDLGNYSERRDAQAVVPLVPQLANISVDIASGVVTVNTQPANMTISGTTRPDINGAFVLNLKLENEAGRTMYGLKAKTSNLAGGTLGLPAFEGEATFRFGPRGLGNGSRRSRETRVTPVGNPTEFSFDIEILDNPVLIASNQIYDPEDIDIVSSASMGTGDGSQMQNHVTASGEEVIHTARNQPGVLFSSLKAKLPPEVFLIDPNFEGGQGNSASAIAVEVGAGAIFTGLNSGVHLRGSDGNGNGASPAVSSITLVRIDKITREITDELVLATDDSDLPTIRGLVLSKDQNVLAVLVGKINAFQSEIVFVNPATMTVIDTDPTVAGVQNLTLPGAGIVSAGAWSDASDTLYVGYKGVSRFGPLNLDNGIFGFIGDPVHRIEFATFSVADLGVNNAAPTNELLVRDGEIYILSQAGLTIIPEAGGEETVPNLENLVFEAAGIVFTPDGSGYYIAGPSDPGEQSQCLGGVLLDAATDTVIDFDGNAGNGITGLGDLCAAPFSQGLAITPY